MTVRIRAYDDSNYWNAGPFDSDELLPTQVLIDEGSTTSTLYLRAYMPDGLLTAIAQGNLQYTDNPSTMADVSGSLVDFKYYINGVLKGHDSFTIAADFNQWLVSETSQAQYYYQASILFQGIDFIGSSSRLERDPDTLIGGGGSDRFTSFAGTNLSNSYSYFDGKGAIDFAIFQGNYSDYVINAEAFIDQTDMRYERLVSGYVIEDLQENRNGYTQVTNVERLQFTDTMLALDTGANENAGNAYLLYQAAFDRTPDVEGLGYWIAQMDNGGNPVRDMAMNFILSDEFKRLYGPNPTVTEFMDLIYQNVLNRAPDADGLAYWLDEFASSGDTLLKRAATLNDFAISAENVANVADQIAGGIMYQAYLG